jgi:hypothetical protein
MPAVRLRAIAGLFLLAQLPVPVARALEFSGVEFQVNTYTSCNQDTVAAAGLADGNFVVVWESGSEAYQQDGSFEGVFGQRFGAGGAPIGTEFKVNTYTNDYQSSPSVAARPEGGFVVVWQSYEQDSDGYGIFGQRYNANGAPVGTEFAVSTHTSSYQYRADVAAAANGFVVVWESYAQDGEYGGIFGQRFNSAGARAGTEFRINTYTTGVQRFPRVGAAPDGRFVVVWQSEPGDTGIGQDGSDSGIFAQRFAANGSPAGDELQVNAYTTSRQAQPDVAVASDGTFVVAWEGRDTLSSIGPEEIFARRFDEQGAPIGTEFRVNTYSTAVESDVQIDVTPDGEFLVVWETETGGEVGTDSSDESVLARQLDAQGQLLGSEFQVNTFTTDDQEDAAVAGLAGGGFAVIWESPEQDGMLSGLFGQRLADALCGDATGDGDTTATDALRALKAALGSASCELCICDVNDSGGINTTDALIVLRVAVGQSLAFSCPAC